MTIFVSFGVIFLSSSITRLPHVVYCLAHCYCLCFGMIQYLSKTRYRDIGDALREAIDELR
jgi:hypothetical protein